MHVYELVKLRARTATRYTVGEGSSRTSFGPAAFHAPRTSGYPSVVRVTP